VPGFLLQNGLEVDLAFTPSAEFTVWAPVRIAFDRAGVATRAAETPVAWTPTPDWGGEAGFAWHDVVHACIAANRGKPWQSLFYLQRVRNRTLALASERHGFDAEEFTHVDQLPAAERDPLRASLVADLERSSLLRAINVATQALIEELGRGDWPLADRLAPPLLAYLRASQEEERPNGVWAMPSTLEAGKEGAERRADDRTRISVLLPTRTNGRSVAKG
jgi:hypothetical protein